MTQDNRLFRWCLAVTVLAAVAWIVLTLPASAEWPNEQLTYRGYKNDLYWKNYHCGGTYRPEGCEAWRHRKWRARQVAVSSGDALCHGNIDATGDQAQSEANARENALTAWKGRVRFRYGERYTEFKRARDPREVCAPSSVADSGRDKALSQLYRCELSAKPCRAQPQQVETDD